MITTLYVVNKDVVLIDLRLDCKMSSGKMCLKQHLSMYHTSNLSTGKAILIHVVTQ